MHGTQTPDVVRSIQSVDSLKSPLTQVADVLLGAIRASYEGGLMDVAKLDLIEYMKLRLKLSRLDQGSPLRLKGKYNNWEIKLR